MIKLIEDYYIDADKDQYILLERHEGKNKSGEDIEYFRECGFFSSMSTLIKSFIGIMLRLGIQSGQITSMNEWIEREELYMDTVDKLIKEKREE